MTEEQLRQIRERCDNATAGPWFNFGDWMIHTVVDVEHNGIPSQKTIGTVRKENADFIASSRTDIPALLAEVERLQAENSTLKKALELACESIAGEMPYGEANGYYEYYIKKAKEESENENH